MEFHLNGQNKIKRLLEIIKKGYLKSTCPCQENFKGHFTLVSDTKWNLCGIALHQEQRGKLRLAGYNWKRFPPAASRYSISELELCGLVVNIHSFKHILRNTEFTVIIYHSALLHILNAKRESPTLSLKKVIEVLSWHSFEVKFPRGKDMTILDVLYRDPGHDLASPNKIIPISFHINKLFNNADNLNNIIKALEGL